MMIQMADNSRRTVGLQLMNKASVIVDVFRSIGTRTPFGVPARFGTVLEEGAMGLRGKQLTEVIAMDEIIWVKFNGAGLWLRFGDSRDTGDLTAISFGLADGSKIWQAVILFHEFGKGFVGPCQPPIELDAQHVIKMSDNLAFVTLELNMGDLSEIRAEREQMSFVCPPDKITMHYRNPPLAVHLAIGNVTEDAPAKVLVIDRG